MLENKKKCAFETVTSTQGLDPLSKQLPTRRILLPVLIKLVIIFGLPMAMQHSSLAQQLSANELAGKKLFLQRCTVCHMPAPSQLADPALPTYGPKLEGYVKDASSEDRARTVIHDGTMRMPGFRYGLTAAEIDNIVTYLKVFKMSDFIRPGDEVGGGPDTIIPAEDHGSTGLIVDPTD